MLSDGPQRQRKLFTREQKAGEIERLSQKSGFCKKEEFWKTHTASSP
jgi:hypothetical protein